MKKLIAIICVVLVCAVAACSKPLIDGRIAKNVRYHTRDYAANPNQLYYAARWALEENGYAVAKEDLPQGTVITTWQPVTSDSHYMKVFDRKDYGVTGSYYQLKIYIMSGGGRPKVRVGAPVKTIVANMMSSGVEEKKILDGIGNYLRSANPNLTNLGITE